MNWNDFFEKVKTKEYFKELMDFIDYEYKNNVCYPPRDKIFEAFKLTSLDNLKVVIFDKILILIKEKRMDLHFQ